MLGIRDAKMGRQGLCLRAQAVAENLRLGE